MRPLELTVAGFASFRDPQTIDFTELEDLFVITGPTGSGKTTLLDAITLALFEEVPRANKRERKEFISIGEGEMKVRFDFRANGDRYRVTRVFPREGSQDASLEQVVDGKARPVLPGANISDLNDEVIRIVGLDADDFTKAVLLPQGEFHKFLKGKSSERKDTGIRLLDLDRFVRAGRIARSRASSFSDEANHRQEIVEEQYGEATEERLDELRTEHGEARERLEDLEEVQSSVDDALRDVEELGRRTEELDRIERAFESVGDELEDLRERWKELEPRSDEIEEELESTEQALEDAQEARDEAAEALSEVREETGGDAELTRLDEARKAIEGTGEEIDKLKERLSKAKDRRESLADEFETADERVDRAESAENEAEEELENAREAGSEAADTLKDARGRKKARKELREASDALEAANEAVEEAEEARNRAAEAVEQARQRRDEVHKNQHVSALRRDLEPGDPCPVCEHGVEDVPAVSEEGEAALEEAEEAVREAEEALEEKRRDLARARKNQTQAASRHEQAEEALADLPAVDLEEARDAHERATEELEEARKARREAEKVRKEAVHDRSEVQADLKGVKERIEGLEEQIDSARERRAAAEQTITDAFPDDSPDDLEAYLEEAREQLDEARTARNEREKALEKARKARTEAERRERSHQQDLTSLDQDITAVRTRLDGATETLERLPELDDLPGAPSLPDDLSRGDRVNRIDGWRADLSERSSEHADELRERRQETLDSILETLAEADLEVADHTSSAIQQTLRTAIGNARERETELRGEVDSTEKAIEKREELEEKIETLREKAKRHSRLAHELQTNRFIQFLLEESFQELAVRASQQLRDITDGRYSLKAEGYDFRIIDHANADEERSVVTLSGGETFLASLSLALALAGGIRDIAGAPLGSRLESIFIDEGFGTLDPDALDLVIDALEQIQQGDRQVGVITHVQTVAERIPAGLRVVPGVGNEGSTVKVRGSDES